MDFAAVKFLSPVNGLVSLGATVAGMYAGNRFICSKLLKNKTQEIDIDKLSRKVGLYFGLIVVLLLGIPIVLIYSDTGLVLFVIIGALVQAGIVYGITEKNLKDLKVKHEDTK